MVVPEYTGMPGTPEDILLDTLVKLCIDFLYKNLTQKLGVAKYVIIYV